MIFSKDSLDLFADLIAKVTIPATHPNLETVAATIATARRELATAAAELTPDEPVPGES